jgi:TfoX/Sxy family transcriptional regulator of competence genes
MAYDQDQARRVQGLLNECPGYQEKKMFGGVGFFIHGNLACGILREDLIVRTGPAEYAGALRSPHARPFDLTCRPMPGWLLIDRAGTRTDAELTAWVELGVGFARTLPRK